MGWRETLRAAGSEVAALVLGATCAGCDVVGEFLCAQCRNALAPQLCTVRTAGGMAVRAALMFEGVPARCIRRLKEQGETRLAAPLAVALAELRREHGRNSAIVPVPTSRAAFRRRGYRVPELLLSHAGAPPTRLLVPTRRTGDQRDLGKHERAENVRGSLRARVGGRGEPVILFDDVVTTGATLDEAARALSAGGFHVVAAFALAATPRRPRGLDDAIPTRPK